jgi:hypothetical protein
VVCGSAKPTNKPRPDPPDRREKREFLVRSAGEDADAILERAELHGYFGDWGAAAADYRRAMGRATFSFDKWTTCLALLAHAGDAASYRTTCRLLLDKVDGYKARPTPRLAEQLAKACLLAEVDELNRVLGLLKVALGTGARAEWRPYAELARGMAEYRRGDHAAAVGWLEGCVRRDRAGMSAECQALRGFFLAMAQHRLGKHDEAAKAYEQARKTWAGLIEAVARGGDNWADVLRATVAEAEARGVLKGRPR